MSSTVTVRPARGVRGIGMISIIVGVILILAGGATWWAVQDQLSAQNITVSEDASLLAGNKVNGPLTAYSQAITINKHALDLAGGKTYAELPQDDPNRQTVATASFLQASLYTSVVAFGVAALVIGLGVMMILFGVAFRRLVGKSLVAVETPALTSSGDLSEARHYAPEHAAPEHRPEEPAGPQTAPTRPEVTEPSPGPATLASTQAQAGTAARDWSPTQGPAATAGTGAPSEDRAWQRAAPAVPESPGASPQASPVSEEVDDETTERRPAAPNPPPEQESPGRPPERP